MKIRKKIVNTFILVVAVLFFGLPLAAQVTFGSRQAPDTNALLDLRENTGDSLSTKGLLLPRVELASTTDTTPLDAHVKGMFVYNTATANDVTPGIYYNDGSKWVREIDTPFVVTTDCNEAPGQLGAISGSKIAGRGAHGLKYAVPPVAGIDFYTWTVPAGWAITAGQGTDEITVSAESGATNGNISVIPKNTCGKGDPQTLAVTYDAAGCGAMTISGTWLRFMCYNLDAADITKTVDQQSVYSSTSVTDETVYGGLYQWGRKGDGAYEKRINTDTIKTRVNLTAPPAGVFVVTTEYPWCWETAVSPSLWLPGYKQDIYDPCPGGWRVPSVNEWQSIFKPDDAGTYDSATANTWTPVGAWTASSLNSGYKVGDALFLPAVGIRGFNSGSIGGTGTNGYYWSSSLDGAYAYNVFFNSSYVAPSYVDRRANGMAIRCVADE